MIENTPRQRREIAEKVNAKGGKRQRYIDDLDDLVVQYREYAYRDLMHRYDVEPGKQRHAKMAANMYADLAAKSLEHDLPALIFFFRQYLTRR